MKKLISSKTIKIVSVSVLVFIISTVTVLAFRETTISTKLKEMFISKEESEKNLKDGIEYTKKVKEEKEVMKQFEKEKMLKENNTDKKIKNSNDIHIFDTNNVVETNKVVDTIIEIPQKVEDKIKEKLSNDKKEELKKLEEKGDHKVGIYTRKTNEILGNISEKDKRISLQEAKQIIATKDFKTAINEIKKINKYPDFEGGSGFTIIEYWLNDEGTELIRATVEQKQIFYYKLDNNFEMVFKEELTK